MFFPQSILPNILDRNSFIRESALHRPEMVTTPLREEAFGPFQSFNPSFTSFFFSCTVDKRVDSTDKLEHNPARDYIGLLILGYRKYRKGKKSLFLVLRVVGVKLLAYHHFVPIKETDFDRERSVLL